MLQIREKQVLLRSFMTIVSLSLFFFGKSFAENATVSLYPSSSKPELAADPPISDVTSPPSARLPPPLRSAPSTLSPPPLPSIASASPPLAQTSPPPPPPFKPVSSSKVSTTGAAVIVLAITVIVAFTILCICTCRLRQRNIQRARYGSIGAGAGQIEVF